MVAKRGWVGGFKAVSGLLQREMQGMSALIGYIFCHALDLSLHRDSSVVWTPVYRLINVCDTRKYEPTGSVHDNDNLGFGDIGEVHG